MWHTIRMGRWLRSEDIMVLGVRACEKGVQRLVCGAYGVEIRQLFLLDNMSLVFCLSRGRARSFEVLVVIRRVYSYCLARGVRPYFRWIPSELNTREPLSTWRLTPKPCWLKKKGQLAQPGSMQPRRCRVLASPLPAAGVSSTPGSARSRAAAPRPVRPTTAPAREGEAGPRWERTLSRGPAAARTAAWEPGPAKRPRLTRETSPPTALQRRRALLATRSQLDLETVGKDDVTVRGDLRGSVVDEDEPSTEESSAAEDAERNAAPTTVQRRAQRRTTRHLA